MKREKNYKTAKFVEALEHIDVKFIEEAGKKIKERPTGQTVAGMSRAKSLRQVLALVACVLLLSAVIPAVTYLMGNLPDILGSSTGDDTTEQTLPETPPEETSSPAPETSVDTDHETTAPLYDGTTAPPDAEYDGSRGLIYKMWEDGKSYYLAGMGTCTDENIVVASIYGGYPVTVIGEDALAGYDRIKSITIPDSVTAIDMRAFKDCTGLESITIPDTVYYISGHAFMNCTSLKSIKLPASLELVNPSVFGGCTALEEIVIPDFVTEIYVMAFYGCTNLKSVTIGRRVEKLWADVFRDCENLTEISFAGTMARWNAIEKDDEWSFGSVVTTVHCTDGDIKLEPHQPPEPEYDGSRGLEYKVNEDGKTASLVGIGTCMDNEIVIASTYNGVPVTTIRYDALLGINAESVIISDSITTIKGSAFRVCENIKTLHIPKGVVTIEAGAFMHMNSLSSITVDPENPNYIAKGNCLIEKNSKLLIRGCSASVIPTDGSVNTIGMYAFSGSEALKSIVVPGGVKLIDQLAFVNCTGLSVITLPDTLTDIEEVAFSGCVSLQSIVFPDSVKSIGLHAFYKCTTLKQVTFGKGELSLGSCVFEECTALEEIVLPEGMTVLTDSFFCTNLNSMTIPSTVTTIRSFAFYGLDKLTNVSFAGTVEQWNSIDKWSGWNEGCPFTVIHCTDGDVDLIEYDGSRGLEYEIRSYNGKQYAVLVSVGTCTDKKIVTATHYQGVPVTEIDASAFDNVIGLTSVTVSEGVTYIDICAFHNCPDLRELHLPSTLVTVATAECNIILGCDNIEIITIPKNAEYFYVEGNCLIEKETGTLALGCKTSVIPTDGSIKAIGYYAFHCNPNLKNIVLPEGITRISHSAFAGCINLQSVTFPKSLEEIDAWAFENCTALQKINIPENVTLISYGAFRACTKIVEVVLPRSLKELSWDSFGQCTALKEIRFTGTKKEWNSITKDNSWYYGSSINAIRCSDGDIYPNVSNGSQGLEYVIREKANGNLYAVLVGIGTCTNKNIVVAKTFNNLPVNEIDDFAFENVGGFTSVTVSEGVTSIGLHAFANCPDLREIYLPSTLDDIYGGEGIAFFGCDALEIISMAENNPKYYSVGNCLIERDTKTLVFGCKNSKIPSGGSVDKIGYYAFSGISSISEIVIPEGITAIYSAAFSSCDNLEKITLPKSLTEIRDAAFFGCISLKSIHIYDGVTHIGSRAFGECSSLKEIRLPARVEYFGEEMFAGCAIESIIIPDGVTALYGGTFVKCQKLKKVTFPDSLEDMGIYTFSQCTALTEFDVPEGVRSVGQSTFEDCAKLARVALPKSIEKIEQNAFAGCSLLTDFRYAGTKAEWAALKKGENWNAGCPFTVVRCSDGNVELYVTDGSRGLEYRIDGDHAVLVGIGTCTDKDIVIASSYNGVPVTEILPSAFSGNKNIVNVRFGDNVEVIGYDAFSGCTNLESIYISASVREIGIEAFVNTSVLAHITVDANNPYFSGVGNCIVEKKTKTLILGCSRTVIPTDGSVAAIGMNAFYGNQLLSTITIPESVTSISNYAFYGCTNLVIVDLPESLKTIGQHAFDGCTRLGSIDLPKSVTAIADSSFKGCTNLRSVTGGEGITVIEPKVFEGCTKLESFEFGNKLTKIDHLAFKNCTGLKSIDVPASVTEIGQEAFSGCTSLESVTIRGNVKSLYGGVFAKCSNLKNVNITGSVGSISDYAFEYCTSLKKITLPEGTKIGRGAFYECTALESVNIPRGGTEIGDEAFSGCSSLTSIVIPEGVEKIELEAFYRCKSLSSVTLPSTLTEIGSWAFAECESLESIVIPDGVTWVSDRAFSDCRKLSSVKFGKNVELIMENAFMYCTSLESVTLPGSLTELCNGAFAGCSNLVSVTFEKGIDRLGFYIFSDCLKLKNISFTGTTAEWRAVFVPEEALGNITVPKIVCSDGETDFYPSASPAEIPAEYLAVLKGEQKFVLDSMQIFIKDFKFPYNGRPITTVYNLTYTVIDMDGDGSAELVIKGDSGDSLVLHADGGKVYGFDFSFRNMDRIKTDGSFEWNDTTAEGLCYGDRRISFDGETCKLTDICHVIGDGTDSAQFFVDGKSATLEEYLDRANLIPSSEPTWYPLETPKAN